MTEVSLFRLYLLRAMYLVMTVGLALTMWPLIVSHKPEWPLMNSVVVCMLGALCVLTAIGIRYPLQMLPVLLFELLWKTIWLVAVALPLWRAGAIDARTMETVWECLPGLVLILVIPWRYVAANYVRRTGDRWRRNAAGGRAEATA